MKMMAVPSARVAIAVGSQRRKNPSPSPLPGGARIHGRWLRKKPPGALDRLDGHPREESGSKNRGQP
jgi:hypothetical protein